MPRLLRIYNPRQFLLSLDRRVKITHGRCFGGETGYSVSVLCSKSWQFMYRGTDLAQAMASFNCHAKYPTKKRVSHAR